MKRILFAVLVFLVGCTSVGTNTPRQDYVYELGRICETANGITSTKIERVDPDGRYWIKGLGSGYEHEYPRFFACMKEQGQARPYLDWLKAQKRDGPTSPPMAIGSVAQAVSSPPGPILAPIWKVGDEWQYAYKGPSDSGTYVWSVNRIEMLDGTPHYVIKAGTREIFYRVSDLASSLERVDGVVVHRETPARLSYTWPLIVGKSWDQSHREERPIDRQTTERSSAWVVEAEDMVMVPAGTFQAFKVTRRNKNTGAVITEAWYAPEVKQAVRIREILTTGIRERELIAFKVK